MKSISKFTQIACLTLTLVMVFTPFLASAQFKLPGSGGTGLPNTFLGCSTVTGCILSIINIILALAGLIAVLVLIIGGFRYVTSFGNDEVVGQAKKMILNAIIGIVIIILSFVVVRVVSNIALNPNNI
jgi:lysylphosphatidylglycerol synthetase-like protein (DUF2156 family)